MRIHRTGRPGPVTRVATACLRQEPRCRGLNPVVGIGTLVTCPRRDAALLCGHLEKPEVKAAQMLMLAITLALSAAAQDQPSSTEKLPFYEKLRSSHKLPKWAETACFWDGMHDQFFFVMRSTGRWNLGRIGGPRLRLYDNGVVDSETHLKLERSADTGSSKYFLSELYRHEEGWARWRLVVDGDTNRFTLKSVSVNTGRILFDSGGHCMDIKFHYSPQR